MSRPSLGLRKPKPATTVDIEAFVNGAQEEAVTEVEPVESVAQEVVEASPAAPPPRKKSAREPALVSVPAPKREESRAPKQTSPLPTFQRASKALIERKTKGAMRRTTVYMRLDLAQRLAEYCGREQCEMSQAVNEAIEAYLDNSAR
jgi:hypothetical protein